MPKVVKKRIRFNTASSIAAEGLKENLQIGEGERRKSRYRPQKEKEKETIS